MSRNALLLEKAWPGGSSEAVPEPVPRPGAYFDLTLRLFKSHSVVAVIGSGSVGRGPEACRGIAAELAASGHRVVIVQVDEMLRTSPIPEAAACRPGRVPNVSLWPSTDSAPVEFYQSPAAKPSGGSWLGSLRREFDAVLLDCPPLESAPAAAVIAATADEAVLVVEAGRSTKEQIRRDQRALELRGIKLAGCVLMRRR